MPPRQITVRMTVEDARHLSTDLQAMLRAYESMSAEEARKGIVIKALQFAQRAEDCSRRLEAVEQAIAQRPLPLHYHMTEGVRQ